MMKDIAPSVYTAVQVAEMLGLKPVSIAAAARKHGAGQKIGKTWLFTDADIDLIKAHQGLGRPADPEAKYHGWREKHAKA